MIIGYTVLNSLCFFIAYKTYKNYYNPICLYSIVWQIALTIHESGLIIFYELSFFTWFIIMLIQIFFIIGTFIGNKIKLSKKNTKKNDYDENILKNELKKWIIITTVISGIAILFNFWHVVKIYGLDLISSLTDVYSDRVNNLVEIEAIPYLGSFIYIAFSLNGMYLKKFGFTLLTIPSFILVFINSLTSGGRAGIVFNLIIFISSYIFIDDKNIRIRIKNKFFIVLGTILFFIMIILVSNQRVAGIQLTYATGKYTKIFGNNILIYKVLTYIGGPIGVLNEYLKRCDFSFGQNTFLTFYNLLSKIKIIERINQYQEFYYIPIRCNVGTWIREIIEDFTIGGALLSTIVFGAYSGYVYKAAKKTKKIQYVLVLSMIMLVIGLSFFDWRFRSSNIWISIIFGWLITKNISKKMTIVREEELIIKNEKY